MTKLQEFYEKLNQYEPNSGTLELRSIIEKVLYSEPTKILYKGEYWDFFVTSDKKSGKTYTLRVNPKNLNKHEFEVVEMFKYFYVTQIKRINYVIGLYSDMYVKKETIKNKILNQKIGGQLLLDATKTEERFTKQGFQKCKKIEEIIGEHFIFLPDEIKNKYELFVPSNFTHNPDECPLSDIAFPKNKIDYWLSSLNYSIKASLEETNGLVVFYKENNNTLCFPAFFDNDKSIYLKEFIKDASLQFYGQYTSGIEEENISFEGHSLKDAQKFYKSKHDDVEFIREFDRFKTLNKKLEQ